MASVKAASSEITDRILTWYASHQRDLPWRRSRHPYHIWVAEVMLQQTQVDTVIPYYERFLSRFPTIRTLAEASLATVLKVWENMGYYARARHLHAAARDIMQRFDGKVPMTREELITLPGVGDYTAGAILSMAFGQPVPAVDANVRRVLSRVFAIQAPLHQSQTERQLWDLAKTLVPTEGAGQFNQGLMDLGATVCTSREPKCVLCPIKACCQAYAHQLQDALPVTRKRGPIPHCHLTAGVIWNDCEQVLIVRRSNQGLLGGLWKFPGGTQEPGESLRACLGRQVRRELGIQIRVGPSITLVNHAYTHFRITLHAFQCTHTAGTPKALNCADWRWSALHRLQDFAFSKADRKIVHTVLSKNAAQTCSD